jgi:hypothetical protein
LNDKPLDLFPPASEISNDVDLFLEYMEGYHKFHGDVELMQASIMLLLMVLYYTFYGVDAQYGCKV